MRRALCVSATVTAIAFSAAVYVCYEIGRGIREAFRGL